MPEPDSLGQTPPQTPARIPPQPPQFSEAVQRAQQGFIDQLGDEDEILLALSMCPPNFKHYENVRQMCDMLAHPQKYLHQRTKKPLTFIQVACACRVEAADLAEIWRMHYASKAILLAMKRIPEAAYENSVDALPGIDTCPRCDGQGTIPGAGKRAKPRVCPLCKGKRVVRKPGDKDSKQMAFQMTGLLKGGNGPSVAVNVNMAPPTVESTLAEFDTVEGSIARE